jgi:UDP-N-acetylmuramyl pentapeptide synthase
MSALVVVDDVEHRLDGAIVHVRIADETFQIRLDSIGDAAVDAALSAVIAALGDGAMTADAVEAAHRVGDVRGRCQLVAAANGVIVIDDTLSTTVDQVRRSLKVLADATRGVTRSFAVMGELQSPPSEWFDDHDGLGRLIVRLDISQLIVVGHGARHTSTAAGLEGSWDGESILVADADAAYDELRARIRPGDAVLITSAGITPLDSLVARLTEETS